MKKIFLLDDDQTMQELLKTLLQMDGYKVLTTNNKENIIDKIKSEKPDLVLLDVLLKNKNRLENNGIDILKEIRSDPDLKDIHVIMTSGIDFREKCLRSGADDFVLKPFMPEELIAKIRESIR